LERWRKKLILIFFLIEIAEKLNEFVKKENYQARINMVKVDPENSKEMIAAWVKAYKEVGL